MLSATLPPYCIQYTMEPRRWPCPGWGRHVPSHIRNPLHRKAAPRTVPHEHDRRRSVPCAGTASVAWAQQGRRSSSRRPDDRGRGDPVAFEARRRCASAGTSAMARRSRRTPRARSLPTPTDGVFDVTLAVAWPSKLSTMAVRVTDRPSEKDAAALERTEAAFRARARTPATTGSTYRWDFGDGTVRGPSEGLRGSSHLRSGRAPTPAELHRLGRRHGRRLRDDCGWAPACASRPRAR